MPREQIPTTPIPTVTASPMLRTNSPPTQMTASLAIATATESQMPMTPTSKNLKQVQEMAAPKVAASPKQVVKGKAKVRAKDKDKDRDKAKVKVRDKDKGKVKVKVRDKDK